MANTVTTPPVYPNVDTYLPGLPTVATTWDRMAGLVNRAGRDQVGGCCIAQWWADGVFEKTGDVETRITPAGWAVPILGPQHSRIVAYVEASSDTGGTIRLHSVEADDNAIFDIPAGGAVTEVGPLSLNIADDGSGGDVVEAFVEADGAAGVVVVQAVWALHTIVGALGPTCDTTPFGRDDATLPYRPLTAARGRQMISSLAAAQDRPRPMVAWAAIDDVDGDGVPVVPEHGVAGLAMYHGARESPAYTAAIHTDATGLDGQALIADGAVQLIVAADDPAKWNHITDDHQRLEGARVHQDGRLSFRPVELRTAGGRAVPEEDVIVSGFSMWGP